MFCQTVRESCAQIYTDIAIFWNVDWRWSCMNNIICSGMFLISAFFVSPANWTRSLACSMTVADGYSRTFLKSYTIFCYLKHFSFYAPQILIGWVLYKMWPPWTILPMKNNFRLIVLFHLVFVLVTWHKAHLTTFLCLFRIFIKHFSQESKKCD